MLRHRHFYALIPTACAAAASVAIHTQALAEHVVPDWRGEAGATYFGWDVLEFSFAPGIMGGQLLNDSTPDLGTAPSGATFAQVGAMYGHISSTNNYYSGFSESLGANDTITTAGSGQADGFTTVIFQMTEQDLGLAPTEGDAGAEASRFIRTDFTLNGVAPDTANFASGVNSDGVSQWFAQWEVAGSPASIEIAFSNQLAHTALDLWEVDIRYSATGGNLIETPQIVPEPGSLAAVLGLGGLCMLRRRR